MVLGSQGCVLLDVDFVIRWTGKLLKNLKTPFFSRYSKFLPMANWYRSRTSPKFFSKKNSNKCGRKSRPKFWPKWAVAGRLVEQGQKFFCQFSADTWWTSPENFSSIARFIFELLANYRNFVVTNGLLMVIVGNVDHKEANCYNKFSVIWQ